MRVSIFLLPVNRKYNLVTIFLLPGRYQLKLRQRRGISSTIQIGTQMYMRVSIFLLPVSNKYNLVTIFLLPGRYQLKLRCTIYILSSFFLSVTSIIQLLSVLDSRLIVETQMYTRVSIFLLIVKYQLKLRQRRGISSTIQIGTQMYMRVSYFLLPDRQQLHLLLTRRRKYDTLMYI